VARLGIDRDFLWEFGKLERAIQEKVHAAFAKFEQATHSGVHLEKINNVRAARLRSIRTTSRLLDGVGDADLGRLGIDEQVLPFARVLTELDQLESARGILPEPQYDVLVGLAIGMTPEQVWEEMAGAGIVAADYDTSDVTAAVARSPQRVVLVSGPDELMEVFSYPFALWRIYLHPTQHQMAHGAFSGSARVTGGPGTGKTVVALHRAQHLGACSSSPAPAPARTWRSRGTGHRVRYCQPDCAPEQSLAGGVALTVRCDEDEDR
jgi:hypothetical protein